MKNKVLLISIDGMRPDGLLNCNHPFVKEFENKCAFTYKGSSVNPSITLPCHFSMTHSVHPQRHGIISNIYAPQVRPIKGLFEKIKENGLTTAFFYGWEPLRDIALPGSLNYGCYVNYNNCDFVDNILTNMCIDTLKENKPDFAFLYLVDTDETGHHYGWMTQQYLQKIYNAFDNVKKLYDLFKDDYHIIIMSDHGGHDRTHGTLLKEDMTIPFFFYGKEFKKQEIQTEVSLIDIAPTIVKLLGIEPDCEWEGHSII